MIQIDMPMPDSCSECRFETERGFCKAMTDNFCGYTKYEGKPEWCPLKEQQEIVRCKDCKYCVKEPNGELYCDILAVGYEPLGSKKVNGDWFCADAWKRDSYDGTWQATSSS